MEVGLINILAKNPVATNGHAASKANRPTGTQPNGPYVSGEERQQTHFRTWGFETRKTLTVGVGKPAAMD